MLRVETIDHLTRGIFAQTHVKEDGSGMGLAQEPAYIADNLAVSLRTSTGTLDVLRNITFEVHVGEIVAIVGRSGTGKSTLLRVLGGLLPPTSGVIDAPGRQGDESSGGAITVFQDYGNALLPWRTVSKNVALGLEGKVSASERAQRVSHALEMVDLQGFEDEYPWRLSGGMQQRVQIARALAIRPGVLLMDEPFGALDAITKASLQDGLLAMHAQAKPTIIFITHDLEEAIYLSDRVFVIAGSPGSGRPGTLINQTSVKLERPRNQIATREDPQYIALRHELMSVLNNLESTQAEHE